MRLHPPGPGENTPEALCAGRFTQKLNFRAPLALQRHVTAETKLVARDCGEELLGGTGGTGAIEGVF